MALPESAIAPVKETPAAPAETPAKPAEAAPEPAKSSTQMMKALTAGLKRHLSIAEPEEPKKVEPEPVKAAEPAKEPEAKAEEPKKVKVTKRKAPSETEEVVRMARDATATAKEAVELARESRKQEPKPDKAKEPEIPAGYEREVAIYKRLEEKFPDDYKGVAAKVLAGIRKAEAYQETWEKENQGQHFKEEDHREFLDKLQPDVDDLDLQAAVASIEAEAASGKDVKRMEARMAEMEAELKRSKQQPALQAKKVNIARSFLAQVAPEFQEAVGLEGINEAKAKEYLETQPIKAGIALRAAHELAEFTGETHRLLAPETTEKDFDQNNPVHGAVLNFVTAIQAKLASMSPSEQQDVWDSLPSKQDKPYTGQRFYRRGEFSDLPVAKKAEGWQLEAEDVVFLRAGRLANEVAQTTEQQTEYARKVAKSLGYAEPSGSNNGHTNNPPTTEEAKPTAAKPVFPTGSGSPKIDTNAQPAKNTEDNWRTRFRDSFIGATLKP